MAIALVDVDGTLLCGRTSSERLFIGHLIASRTLGLRQSIDGLRFFPRWVWSFGLDTSKKNKAYLSGLDIGAVKRAAETFVETTLVHRLRPLMLERIERHRQRGDIVALLSGTPDFLAEPLARRVGADIWCATRCAREDGVFLPEPPVVHPYGDEKLELAQAMCRENGGADLGACTAYADTIQDLLLLRHVGHPVAVFPDPPLKRIALRQGWEVLSDGC
ncbi:MAG: HAD-IB family phosphatase [Rhodospirillales bacterium]|nr:HAD-IB family phosphatase [Rhodospirillales bacterium]